MATALAGDLDRAARLADQALADRAAAGGPPAQRAESAYVSAVAMAHRGRLDSAAELLRWAGPGPAAGFRAVALTRPTSCSPPWTPATTARPPCCGRRPR